MADFYNLPSTEDMARITETVTKNFADERYVDAYGIVWVGFGEAPDEVWIIESGSDEGYMTKTEMLLKMVNELREANPWRPLGTVVEGTE